MNKFDCEKSEEFSSNLKDTNKVGEVSNIPCNSALNGDSAEISSGKTSDIIPHYEQNVSENSERQGTNENQAICETSTDGNSDSKNSLNIQDGQSDQVCPKDSLVLNGSVSSELNNSVSYTVENAGNLKLSEAVVKVFKPLCADYKSDSENESESFDSESDSSTASADSTIDTSSEDECTSDSSCDSDSIEKEKKLEGKNLRKDLSFSDLPPIEDLKITVPEDACVEIGTITSIVETLVVVESYKGTAALDLDTVLFLDCGKRTLGKVFDVLGPVTEPVYTVRFNSQQQIKNLNIEKNLKVYYAPKTQHTAFVFMSEVLKNKGSDASWKDNTEAPPEFQDFSDDEQERLHKNKLTIEAGRGNLSLKEQSISKKRPYNKVTKPHTGIFQTSGFRNPNFHQGRRSTIPRNPTGPLFPPLTPSGSPSVFDNIQAPLFANNVPPHSSPGPIPVSPRVCFPPRFSGPAYPMLASLPLFSQNQNFQFPFYQQRAHGYLQSYGSWGRPMRPTFGYQVPPPPPPPPPPPHPPSSNQGDHKP